MIKLNVVEMPGLLLVDGEGFGGLERRNLVLRNDQSGVLGDVAGGLLSSALHYEAAEATEIHVLVLLQRFLHVLHERFYYYEDIRSVQACLFGNLGHNFCFCHDVINSYLFLIINILFVDNNILFIRCITPSKL